MESPAAHRSTRRHSGDHIGRTATKTAAREVAAAINPVRRNRSDSSYMTMRSADASHIGSVTPNPSTSTTHEYLGPCRFHAHCQTRSMLGV